MSVRLKNQVSQNAFLGGKWSADSCMSWHSVSVKSQALGVRGKLLNWFQNYLTDRRQAVVITGQKSAGKRIPAGVPQGSVLGPLLSLMFINVIGHSIESIIKLIADDTRMSLGLTNPDTRAEMLTCEY